MKSIRSIGHALLVTTLLVFPIGARAVTPCTGDQPRTILNCLRAAYETRDIDAYAALLADDFTCSFGDKGAGWNREQDLKQTGNLFADRKVKSIKPSVHGKVEARPGSAPDTWVLSGFTFAMDFEAKSGEKLDSYHVTNDKLQITVRRVAEPEPHFVIVEWKDLQKTDIPAAK